MVGKAICHESTNGERAMKVVPILLTLLLSAASHPQSATTCGVEALPSAARHILVSKLPHWRVVTAKDLISDDRELWVTAHGETCPGIVEGHFEGSSTSYAVSLIKGNQNKLLQMLVILTPTGHGYLLRTVDPPSVVARPLVITKAPLAYITVQSEIDM